MTRPVKNATLKAADMTLAKNWKIILRLLIWPCLLKLSTVAWWRTRLKPRSFLGWRHGLVSNRNQSPWGCWGGLVKYSKIMKVGPLLNGLVRLLMTRCITHVHEVSSPNPPFFAPRLWRRGFWLWPRPWFGSRSRGRSGSRTLALRTRSGSGSVPALWSWPSVPTWPWSGSISVHARSSPGSRNAISVITANPGLISVSARSISKVLCPPVIWPWPWPAIPPEAIPAVTPSSGWPWRRPWSGSWPRTCWFLPEVWRSTSTPPVTEKKKGCHHSFPPCNLTMTTQVMELLPEDDDNNGDLFPFQSHTETYL